MQKIGLVMLAFIIFVIIIFSDVITESSRKFRATLPISTNSPNRFNSITNITERENKNKTNSSALVNHSYRSFNQTFLQFPWNDFEEAVLKERSNEIVSFTESLIDKLTFFLELEPLVPVNEQCLPPSLPSPPEINCTLYPEAFTGVKKTKPIKIGVLLQFGFDVDVLEIHLNELYGVADKFFIIEATHAHYGKLKKPLMWEWVKRQKRFQKFPVVHLIIDDAESSNVSNDDIWSMEKLQERRRWEKFLEWNDALKFFGDDDIIGKKISVFFVGRTFSKIGAKITYLNENVSVS